MRTSGALPGAVVATMVVLVACQGGRDGAVDAAGSPAAPRRVFVQHADAICFEAAAQLSPLGGREELGGPSREAVVKFRVAVPIYRMMIAGLGQLEPPAGAEAEVEALVGHLQDVADQGEEVVAAGRAGEKETFRSEVAEFWTLLDEAIAANHEFGLACP